MVLAEMHLVQWGTLHNILTCCYGDVVVDTPQLHHIVKLLSKSLDILWGT